MQANKKEILICLIAILALLLAVAFFYKSLRKEKVVTQIDLYDLVAPDPSALLVINRPGVFAGQLVKKKPIESVFSGTIPLVFISILKEVSNSSVSLLSFHKQGVILYLKASPSLISSVEKQVLTTLAHTYSPEKQKKYDVDFYYYPDVKNRFLGYYERDGVWVLSYSRKLLEQVALQQVSGKKSLPGQISGVKDFIDTNSPLNILFSADSLDLYVNITDSTEWRIQDQWLGIDIFLSEGNVCCYGALPYYSSLDTLYAPMSDTLTQRIQDLYPALTISFEQNKQEQSVYFTGCISTSDD